MGRGTGYGKVILFNEHFVVHHVPSIASAIDSQTEAIVERASASELVPSGNEGSMAGEGWVLEDDRDANPDYKHEKLKQQKKSVEFLLKAAGFDAKANNIRITLGGDLKAVGGVGASAAVCVSLARALSDEFDLGFDDERVNAIAYEGERAYAGSPSGIDNTVSTFGGLISFQKGRKGEENTISRLSVREPMRIVMGNTGLTANTEGAVDGVKKRKKANPERYNQIFIMAEDLYSKARLALAAYDLRTVGQLMNINHTLLQDIEVSHPKLEELVDIARANGAWGAKMTGGGLGGYMVALTPNPELQERVARAMDDAGYEALCTSIGV